MRSRSCRGSSRFPLWVVVPATIAGVSAGLPAHSQENTFQFKPPAPLTYTVTDKTTKSQDIPRQGKVTEISILKSRTTIKRIEEGYSATQVVISESRTVNGKHADSPIVKGMLNVPVSFKIDPEGKLLQVGGMEALSRKIASAFPPGYRLGVSIIMNKDLLSRMFRSDWNLETGHLLGHNAREGEEWSVEDEFNFPVGQVLPGTVSYKVGGEVACGNGKGTCVRVRMTEMPNPQDLEAAVEDELGNDLKGTMEGVKISVLDLKGSETEDFKIDPTTLLVYSSNSTTTISFNADLGSAITVPVLMQTTTIESYDYGVPAKPGVAPGGKPKAGTKRKAKPKRR